MKKIAVVFFLCGAVFSFAQTREDTVIYIPMPTGGSSEQQKYFQENFTTETTAAGYTVVDREKGSDYILDLLIKPNMITYDDGTQEQAPPDEKQFIIELHLLRTGDGTEIVMFDFPFTNVEEMYEFNLYLLYQAMANVPLTKLTAVLETDHWRNKWIYFKASFDYSLVAYFADPTKDNLEKDVYDKNNNGDRSEWISLSQENSSQPVSGLGATLGTELQFLNWMSAEAFFKLLFGGVGEETFVPTLGLSLKFPLKLARHFMIEPYGVVDFPLSTTKSQNQLVGVGGGVQFGVKGGEMGAFFVDASYVYDIGNIYLPEDARRAYWNRWVLGFSLGYKIGFFNRNKDAN
jgi:hypothetical protein